MLQTADTMVSELLGKDELDIEKSSGILSDIVLSLRGSISQINHQMKSEEMP